MGEAGSGVEVKYRDKFTDQTITSTAPDDPWYTIQGYIYITTTSQITRTVEM